MANRRKKPNRERRRTKETISEAVPRLRVSIITFPEAGSTGLTLRRDLELMKASLLYADEVELISPGAAMAASMVRLGQEGLPAVVEMFSMMDDQTLEHVLGRRPPANFRQMLPWIPRMLSPEVAAHAGLEAEVAEYHEQLAPMLSELQGVTEKLALDAGAEELVPALEAGILKLDAAGFEDGQLDAGIMRFCDLIVARLKDPRRRVLFDAGAGDLARTLVDVTGSDLAGGMRRAGEAAVGSGLIARLPAFPHAPTDELLDLRKDLRDPLQRYRAATMKFSKNLQPVLGPELEGQVDDLWHSEVSPALLSLKEQLADHSLVAELARHAGQDLKGFLSGSLLFFMGVTTATSLGSAADVLISAGGGAATAAGRAALERHKAQLGVSRHELFFLYESNRRIGASAA